MKANYPVVTRHLSGCGMVPHNWSREYPNRPRSDFTANPDQPGDITNYAQIKVWEGEDGAFCDVWFNQDTVC